MSLGLGLGVDVGRTETVMMEWVYNVPQDIERPEKRGGKLHH